VSRSGEALFTLLGRPVRIDDAVPATRVDERYNADRAPENDHRAGMPRGRVQKLVGRHRPTSWEVGVVRGVPLALPVPLSAATDP
jgi:hypothetical protein